MTTQSFSGGADRGLSFLPHLKRFEQNLALLVRQVAKTCQRDASRFDHHLRGGERGGSQDRSVEYRDCGGIRAAPQCHFGKVQSLRRLAQIVDFRAYPDPADRRPRYTRDTPVELLL